MCQHLANLSKMTRRSFNRGSGFDRKINNLRRKGRELSVLSNPTSTQEERKFALQTLKESRERQQPPSAYMADNLYQLPNQVDQSRPSVEEDMNRQVNSAHGYPTFAPGYQQFTNAEVTTDPRVLPQWNISNWDYSGERTERAKRRVRAEAPSVVIRNNLQPNRVQYTESVISGLKKQSDQQRIKIGTIFERFERTNQVATQEELYMIAHRLGIITEKYESTQGSWVVVNPFAEITTPEELIYNQTGISGKTQKELAKDQTGTYWRNADSAYQDVYYPQVAPAKPVPGSEETNYYAGKPETIKSRQSLRNPKRGEDFIRNNRVQAAMAEGVTPSNAQRARTSAVQQRSSAQAAERAREKAAKRVQTAVNPGSKLNPPQKTQTAVKKPFATRTRAFRNNDDGTKAVANRRMWREEQIQQLNQLIEGEMNSERKKRYLRKIKELENLNVTEAAAVKNKARREAEYRINKDRVAGMANSVSNMNSPDYQNETLRREQMAYNRHLSLLSEATKMLSKGATGNLLY